ncbi:hypothetical protein M426DRAFT_260586 [Hypoxylon sp. CI-4A]|nr:hypothetical protein M426DRAFT_260586 [Hypoxylon sp. CI-4A]
MATDIKPYEIKVSPSDVEDLNLRLLKARLPEDEPENDWERGPPIQDIRRIANYWHKSFSWARFEEKLNKLPNYEATISVDGFEPFQLHFLHQKSSSPDAIPLLFAHGWPGSFYEVVKLLPLLGEGKPSFHIVAPSLPNFGFSSGITKRGFGMKQYVETCHKLMQSLGYTKYAAQGGDWGSSITRLLAKHFPESVLAAHINIVVSTPPPDLPASVSYTPSEDAGIKKLQTHQGNRNGYYEIQRQRPNTIGVALADSPVGLLTWIYDKLVSWTDEYPWTDEEVCEWISIYWFSPAGPGASVKIYNEAFKGEWVAHAGIFAPDTKFGFSYFPQEMFRTPNLWNKQIGDVVYEKEHERGGHFAAWEQPEALAGDLQAMFDQNGATYGLFQKE